MRTEENYDNPLAEVKLPIKCNVGYQTVTGSLPNEMTQGRC